MNEKNMKSIDEQEVNLTRIFRAVLDRAWMVAIISVLCAVLAFGCTFFFITPQYQSTAMFYVNNSNLSIGDASLICARTRVPFTGGSRAVYDEEKM